jgi:hypothetical protein
MFKTNVGRLDRILRLVAGAALALIGLFVLGGWQGKSAGIDLALFALWPLMTGFFGFCGIYLVLGISTVENSKGPIHSDIDIPPSQNTSHGVSELPDVGDLGKATYGGSDARAR